MRVMVIDNKMQLLDQLFGDKEGLLSSLPVQSVPNHILQGVHRRQEGCLKYIIVHFVLQRVCL